MSHCLSYWKSSLASKPWHHFSRKQLQSRENLTAVVKALRDQEKALVDGDSASGFLDPPRNGVWIADQEFGVVLPKRFGPRIPKPQHIARPLLRLRFCFRHNQDASPTSLISGLDVVTKLGRFLPILSPQLWTKSEIRGQHNRFARILRPKERLCAYCA